MTRIGLLEEDGEENVVCSANTTDRTIMTMLDGMQQYHHATPALFLPIGLPFSSNCSYAYGLPTRVAACLCLAGALPLRPLRSASLPFTLSALHKNSLGEDVASRCRMNACVCTVLCSMSAVGGLCCGCNDFLSRNFECPNGMILNVYLRGIKGDITCILLRGSNTSRRLRMVYSVARGATGLARTNRDRRWHADQ